MLLYNQWNREIYLFTTLCELHDTRVIVPSILCSLLQHKKKPTKTQVYSNVKTYQCFKLTKKNQAVNLFSSFMYHNFVNFINLYLCFLEIYMFSSSFIIFMFELHYKNTCRNTWVNNIKKAFKYKSSFASIKYIYKSFGKKIGGGCGEKVENEEK